MTRDDIIRLASGFASYPTRWFETLEVCDLIADKETGDVAMIRSIQKQRHMKAPDMFDLEFSDGSYMGASDNELSAQYRPYVLLSRIGTSKTTGGAR